MNNLRFSITLIVLFTFLSGIAQIDSNIHILDALLPRKYNIPLIDISGETFRHVVIDRDSTKYFGHPSTLLMPDGKTMYCGYSINHGGEPLFLKKSTDGGLTWSGYLPVPANANELGNCPFLFYLPDSKGKERLLMMVGGDDGIAKGMWQASSYDGGIAWSDYIDNGCKSVVASPTMISPDKGKKWLIWHHAYSENGRNAGKNKALNVYQSESTDGGETWGNTHVMCAIENASPCEPAALVSPNGRTMVCLMRENSRRLNSVVSFSKNEGQTWSAPKELPAALTGDRHQPKYTSDKKHLLIAFRDMATESPTKGDYVLWIGTFEDIENGSEGLCRVKLLNQYGTKGDCGYSGLELLPDGTFIATTYVRYRPEDKYNSIISVRFKIEEILNRLANK